MAPHVLFTKESVTKPSYISCLPSSLIFEKKSYYYLYLSNILKNRNVNDNDNSISINSIEKIMLHENSRNENVR